MMDVVLTHWFRPKQEHFRLALEGGIPKLLTVGNQELKSEKLRTEFVAVAGRDRKKAPRPSKPGSCIHEGYLPQLERRAS